MKFVLLLLLVNLPAFAASDCDYQITLQNATIMVTDTLQVVPQTIQLTRGPNSAGGNKCDTFRVFFSKGLANAYQREAFTSGSTGVQHVDYNLHRFTNMSGILKDFNDAVSSSEYVEANAPQLGVPYTTNFYISVPATDTQGYPIAGTYTDNVQVSFYGYKSNNGKYQFDESRTFTVTIIVNKKIDVSLIDEGGTFNASSTSKTLDFGLIAQDQVKGVDLRVQSNTPYQVQISSQNNGALKNSSSNSATYQFTSNGTPYALTGSATSPVGFGSGNPTAQSGDLYNLKFKITSDPTLLTAGQYQDVLTITAIAN